MRSPFSSGRGVGFAAVACGFFGFAQAQGQTLGAANAPRESRELERFRAMFTALAEAQGAEQVDKLLLMPTAAMMTASPAAAAAVDAAQANRALVAQARGISAESLYANTLATQAAPSPDLEALFASHGPATLIIIPGIFGEFIPRFPLHEVFTGASSFAAAYQDKLAQGEDEAFSLAALAPVKFKLNERVHLGGIDGTGGAPHVQAIYLQAAFGSLESFGANADNATIFLNRLNKVFAQIPLEQCRNIYLVGYSQGTDVALDMLTQAEASPDQYPFLKNLRGVLTMSGVIYGTEAADDAYSNPSSTMAKTLDGLQQTLANLQVDDASGNFITTSGKVLKDWESLISFAQAQSGLPKAPVPTGLSAEHLAAGDISPMAALTIFHSAFTGAFSPNPSPEQSLLNLKRLRLLLTKIMEGTKGLSTQSRIDWWATHLIPTTMPIYSLATSMPSATSADYVSPLLNSPYYGSPMYDYERVLRPGFYSLEALTPSAMNDSQVLTMKERIYPELIAKWNPQQAPFPTHFLGVLGTHHWGVAFPTVLDSANGAENPFPRRALAEAVGAFLLAPSDPSP